MDSAEHRDNIVTGELELCFDKRIWGKRRDWPRAIRDVTRLVGQGQESRPGGNDLSRSSLLATPGTSHDVSGVNGPENFVNSMDEMCPALFLSSTHLKAFPCRFNVVCGSSDELVVPIVSRRQCSHNSRGTAVVIQEDIAQLRFGYSDLQDKPRRSLTEVNASQHLREFFRRSTASISKSLFDQNDEQNLLSGSPIMG
ncbi:hypothetical protein Bbelb_183270 [Branchiostoma belcheri]|nr:hypothetical protein Bbelb_183270 [Branchiostoma belcheri]